MAEFTIVLENMIIVPDQRGSVHLEAQDRFGDVIEADDINQAWDIALKKYHMDASKQGAQIVDILPGNVEVTTPERVKMPNFSMTTQSPS